MKKNLQAFMLTAFLALSVFFFSSCFKDKCSRSYKIYTPVYTKLTELRSAVQSKPAGSLLNTGKLFVRDNWIFLNEVDKGIHIIDNSHPSQPVKASFINIPGNVDMYVKGDILYADLYCDLLAIDIKDPKHIAVTKYLTNTFPEKSSYSKSSNPDSISIITDWLSKDTTVSCEAQPISYNCATCSMSGTLASSSSSAASKAAGAGMAGSQARFAAIDDYMYTVSRSDLSVINIGNPSDPFFVKKKNIGWDIETIFPYNNKLYIGAASSMSVYDLQDPVNPQKLSWNGHWCSKDPVVADDNYAYVTLHEANVCGSKINQLEIYDLKTPNNPVLVKAYPLKKPQGLSKDGNLLLVCDDGLKIYDVSKVADAKLLKHVPGINTYDVIADNGIAYVTGTDGLYQYDYSNLQNVRLVSKLLK